MRSRKIEHLEDAFLPFEVTRVNKDSNKNKRKRSRRDDDGLDPLILLDAAYDPENAMEYGILRHRID